MKTRLFSILGVVILLAAVIGVAPVQAAPKLPDYQPVDVGPQIRQWETTTERMNINLGELLEDVVTTTSSDIEAEDCYGSLVQKPFAILDDYNGGYYLSYFVLYTEGPAAQIWVQSNLSWPAGDPRPTPVITCDQAEYMLGQFEDNIQPTESDFFGPPDFLDGSSAIFPSFLGLPPDYYFDEAGRQIILIENVRDENYYDPTYPLYIAGFYSPTLEGWFDRNTMSIDAYDWANRVGPDVRRPYLYEGTFAHEYQHLLNDDYDPAEENWINEGLSGFAQQICGYGVPIDDAEAFADMPENSLVVWGDQGGLEILADYGNSYLFQEYMFEKYGEEYIQNEFRDGDHQGIASVDYVLGELGEDATFADSYHDFAVAVYTKGAFTNDALSDLQVNAGHPGKPNPDAYATPGAPPWGSDYILLWGYEQIANFMFNGFQFNPLSWTIKDGVLWGGEGDLLDNWAIFPATGGGTLTFDTMYDIEEDWDYGFVQVSTDGGLTWTSLANAYTSDTYADGAHPNIIANMPGLTGVQDWVTMSFDLSAYSGDILLAFRYMTDWATYFDGWFIKNVYVDDILISDGSTTDAFKSLNEVLDISNDYTVTLIGERTRKGQQEYEVMDVMSGGFQLEDWFSIRQMFDNYVTLVMVVTYDAAQGVSSYADYNYLIDHKGGIHIKK